MKNKVFISGKVSGLDIDEAYSNFSKAETDLIRWGYDVVNPMKICKPYWSWLRCMIVCLWNLTWCEKIYLLDNWHESKGARIEYKYAKLLRKI